MEKAEIKNNLKMEDVVLKKVFNEDSQTFEFVLFHVTFELDSEVYMKANPCPVCGMNAEAHEFTKGTSGIVEKCNTQGTIQAPVPMFERGKNLVRCKVTSSKRVTKQQAWTIIQKLKQVPKPDVHLFLLRGK
jgi:hypothetical protein